MVVLHNSKAGSKGARATRPRQQQTARGAAAPVRPAAPEVPANEVQRRGGAGPANKKHVPCVGLMVDAQFKYGRDILKGVHAYGVEVGWKFRHRFVWMMEPSTSIPDWDVDGVIMTAFQPDMHQALRQLKVPVVNVAGTTIDDQVVSVMPDDAAIGRLAAEHLLERRFQTLGYVTRGDAPWAIRRMAGFTRALKAANRTWKVYVENDAMPRRGYLTPAPELMEFVRSLPPQTGLFCSDDSLAGVTVEAAQLVDKRVPEDVAVLGVVNDGVLAQMNSPPLSSIDLNATQVGYRAAVTLAAMMRGETVPMLELIAPSRVVVRRSTDLVAVADSNVAAALMFLREHAYGSITVNDVVAATALSRRPLEMRFKSLLGRTILEEIHRTRLVRAQQLLAETTLPVKRVAMASGFSTSTMLSIVFKRELGISPSEYREQHLEQMLPD